MNTDPEKVLEKAAKCRREGCVYSAAGPTLFVVSAMAQHINTVHKKQAFDRRRN